MGRTLSTLHTLQGACCYYKTHRTGGDCCLSYMAQLIQTRDLRSKAGRRQGAAHLQTWRQMRGCVVLLKDGCGL